jgi:hypothetical protein
VYSTEGWVVTDVEGSLWYYPTILQERQIKTMKILRRGTGVLVEIRTGNLKKR